MELLRSCYSTQMQFGRHGGITVPIGYQWCAPDAPLFPYHHRFGSPNWNKDYIVSPIIGQVGDRPRPWYSGKALNPTPPTIIGTPEEWLNGIDHPVIHHDVGMNMLAYPLDSDTCMTQPLQPLPQLCSHDAISDLNPFTNRIQCTNPGIPIWKSQIELLDYQDVTWEGDGTGLMQIAFRNSQDGIAPDVLLPCSSHSCVGRTFVYRYVGFAPDFGPYDFTVSLNNTC